MMETIALLDADNIQEELFAADFVEHDQPFTVFLRNRARCLGKWVFERLVSIEIQRPVAPYPFVFTV